MPQFSLQIRTAQPRDILVLHRLLTCDQIAQEKQSRVLSVQQLEKVLFSSAVGLEVLLAELEQIPVGFISYFQGYSGLWDGVRPMIHMDGLFVVSERYHLEITVGLIKTLAQIAQARGVHRIEWITSGSQQSLSQIYTVIGARVSASSRLVWLDRVMISRLSHSVHL